MQYWKKEKKRNLIAGSFSKMAACLILSAALLQATPSLFARHIDRFNLDLPGIRNSNLIGNSDEPQDLDKAKIINRKIDAGEIHQYTASLSSGECLRVALSNPDAEMVLSLYDPTGRMLSERNGRYCWTITLSAIAETSGVYNLKVQQPAGVGTQGSYELKVEAGGAATARDKKVMAAEMAFSEAEKLRAQWNVASLLKAIEKYTDALSFWRIAGDRAEQAYTLKSIGDVNSTLSQNRKAIFYYEKALSLSRASGARKLEIEIINRIGYVAYDLNQNQKTLECGNEALSTSRQIGYSRGEAQALINIGLVSYFYSDMEKALAMFNQAYDIWKGLNDTRGQAEALTNLGYAYSDQGDINKAMSCFNLALSLWQESKDRRGLASVLSVIGFENTWLGDIQKSLEAFQQAQQIFQAIGDRNGEAVTLNGIGYAYSVLGDIEKALKAYKLALEFHQALGRQSSAAIIMGHIGKIYIAMGEKQKALGYYNQELRINRALRDHRVEAHTLREIGSIFALSGQNKTALSYYNKSLSLSRAANDIRGQAYTLNHIAYVYERMNERSKALGLYNQALSLLSAAEDRGGFIGTLHNLARVKKDMGDLVGASNNIKTALDMSESFRAKVTNQELRTSYFASMRQHHELYIDVLMRRHKQNPSSGLNATALEISENARARLLLDLLTEARADIRQGVASSMLERERGLEQLLDAKAEHLTKMLVNKSSAEQTSAIKKEIASLTSEYEEVRAQIRVTSPRYAALTQPQTLSLAEIQQQMLDQDTLLLEYSLGKERSYLWAVTPSSIESYELRGREEIEEAARRTLNLLTTYSEYTIAGKSNIQIEKIDAQYWQQAARLSQLLLGPIASRLNNKRLIIVAEGALQYIPFAALPCPDTVATGNTSTVKPLVVKHEIVSLPSASTLDVLRRQIANRTPAAGEIAVIGDPVFEIDDPRVKRAINSKESQAIEASGKDSKNTANNFRGSNNQAGFPRLLATRREAEAILASTTSSNVMKSLDFKASLSTAMSAEMARYRIIHFATHGFLDAQQPELSAIVLSMVDESGKAQNGFLRLQDVYNMNLPAELVVLSACNTALGKDIKGEGMVGITRGFMYAGAARVIASLWKVDDDATAELMRSFYQKTLREGMRPAAALREAQVEVWRHKRWRAPFYWAAFVFQGEWR